MSRQPYRNVSPGPKNAEVENTSGRNPHRHIRGNIFPAARQGQAITASVYLGDDGSDPIPIYRSRPDNAGKDTLRDLRPGMDDSQWDPAWGMAGANRNMRNRWFETINLGKLFAPRIGAMMDGRSDMRPSAIAVPIRAAGQPPPMAIGGRMVAPGRVTRWQQASLRWQNMGKGGDN
jgi:hypothetical protein